MPSPKPHRNGSDTYFYPVFQKCGTTSKSEWKLLKCAKSSIKMPKHKSTRRFRLVNSFMLAGQHRQHLPQIEWLCNILQISSTRLQTLFRDLDDRPLFIDQDRIPSMISSDITVLVPNIMQPEEDTLEDNQLAWSSKTCDRSTTEADADLDKELMRKIGLTNTLSFIL